MEGVRAIEARDIDVALELQRRSDAAGWNLISNAAHPGLPAQTCSRAAQADLFSCDRLRSPFFAHSAADGARPILFAATNPNAKPGAYYGPGDLANYEVRQHAR